MNLSLNLHSILMQSLSSLSAVFQLSLSTLSQVSCSQLPHSLKYSQSMLHYFIKTAEHKILCLVWAESFKEGEGRMMVRWRSKFKKFSNKSLTLLDLNLVTTGAEINFERMIICTFRHDGVLLLKFLRWFWKRRVNGDWWWMHNQSTLSRQHSGTVWQWLISSFSKIYFQ